jgi:hypothetical protein
MRDHHGSRLTSGFMTLQRDMKDMIEPIDKHEPIDSSDPADAIEPADRNEPTEATDNADPFEQIDKTESSDHKDHLELSRARRIDRSYGHPTRRDAPRRQRAFVAKSGVSFRRERMAAALDDGEQLPLGRRAGLHRAARRNRGRAGDARSSAAYVNAGGASAFATRGW